jgi:LmbE family N-acetylglucosaminyl deacetylase
MGKPDKPGAVGISYDDAGPARAREAGVGAEERMDQADLEVDRVLVVVAHPDDIDFGAAGTIATWTDAGVTVVYCVITNGDAGGFDPAVEREDIPGIRQSEQRAAAACVGVHDVRFLGYRDGELEVTRDLRRDLSRVIRQVRPERALIPSPERNWDVVGIGHPDHLAAGEAAMRAIYPDARNPYAFPELLAEEGLDAWSVPDTWIMGAPREKVNTYVDVTDTFERKIAALRAHKSQTAHLPDLVGMVSGWLGAAAVAGGLGADRFAEGFFRVSTA